MSEPVLITPKGLRAALWQTVMHLNMGRVHVLNKACVDYPGLTISDAYDKRTRRATRTVFVAGDDREFATIEEAARAWNALARARASEAA